MATRQNSNKKRKGRNINAPPRERTVTTLTDGTDGPFLSSPLHDSSSPSAVASTPFSAAQPPLSAPPFHVSAFPYNFPHMSSVPSPSPFQSHPPSPHFYAPTISPHTLTLPPSHPPGQKDLEILERLKQTIKNNQHELFSPIPRPAALASVYLGPSSSQVPPHPDQIPADLPPALSAPPARDSAQLPVDSPANSAGPPTQLSSPPSAIWDRAKKTSHRLSVSEFPKTNATSPVKRPDLPSISLPGPNHRNENNTAPSPRFGKIDDSPRMGPPPVNRLDHPGGRLSEVPQSPASASAKPPPVDPKDGARPRDSTSALRNGFDDRDRHTAPRSTNLDIQPTDKDTRTLTSKETRQFERERSRERDHDRDRDRDRRQDTNRYRGDRWNDEKRPNERHYEPRYNVRRYDSKASEGSFSSTGRDDRNVPDSHLPAPNVGQDRAVVRPAVDVSGPPTTTEERRGPIQSLPERQNAAPPAIGQARPDDRRPLPLPATDRPSTDNRRRPPSPASRSLDERHASYAASSTTPVDRHLRPTEDRRSGVPLTATSRPSLAVSNEDRRASTDRAARPAMLEEISRTPAPISTGSLPARLAAENRVTRPAQSEDRNPRPVPLEERITRVPSLQERLSHGASVRPDERPAPRLEERISPANVAPSLEERLSNPATADNRPLRPPPGNRPPRPPLPADRSFARPADDRNTSTNTSRAAPSGQRASVHSDDRHFVPASRLARPASPPASERGQPPRSSRAASVTRDVIRSFRLASPRSPARSDIPEFHPAGDHRERVDSRPPYRPEPDRFTPRSDVMDIDPRFTEGRVPYRRLSPPADSYAPRVDRTWVPAGEAPPPHDNESDRHLPDPHGYSREWREGERSSYKDDWHDRSWDRPRDYDGRFPERDGSANGWETREERERRAAYHPPPPADGGPRSYEPRSLGSRLSDAFPDDRGYSRDLDRGRYPPVDPPTYSRVRPRSPSPLRRSTASDDMRPPPPKRVRDDPYPPGGSYYPPGHLDEPRALADYPPPPPRGRSPLPSGGGYYDDVRYNGSPGGEQDRERDRDYMDRSSRDVGYEYARRNDPPTRMPSPPPYGRGGYERDDRRYSIPPRG